VLRLRSPFGASRATTAEPPRSDHRTLGTERRGDTGRSGRSGAATRPAQCREARRRRSWAGEEEVRRRHGGDRGGGSGRTGRGAGERKRIRRQGLMVEVIFLILSFMCLVLI
jgi:hypothetical protein